MRVLEVQVGFLGSRIMTRIITGNVRIPHFRTVVHAGNRSLGAKKNSHSLQTNFHLPLAFRLEWGSQVELLLLGGVLSSKKLQCEK